MLFISIISYQNSKKKFSEKKISLSTFIPPHTAMETGLTYIKLNEFELANYWFEKAKSDYKGYLLETLLHFRVHWYVNII